MNKIYILIAVFLGSGWGFTYWGKTILENDLTHLKKEYLSLEDKFEGTMKQKMYLEKKIEEQNEKILATSERVCEIEKQAKEGKNKGGFDWNTYLPIDGVTNQLRKD